MTQLACSDNFLNYMVIYFTTVLLGSGALTGILYSYSKIVSSIRRITSTQGKYKAFSTCASHLSVVSLFYCTVLGVYLSPAVTHSSHTSATASVMYTVVMPMLNPFIYSLRNKDIKSSLKRFYLGMPGITLPVTWRKGIFFLITWLKDLKAVLQWFDLCRIKLTSSIYFLRFPFYFDSVSLCTF